MLNCRELTWHSGLRGQAISHLSRVSQYFENPDTHKNININVSFFSSSASSDSLATPKKEVLRKLHRGGVGNVLRPQQGQLQQSELFKEWSSSWII